MPARAERVIAGALFALLALPRALPAQAEGGSAMRFTLGFAARPADDLYPAVGVTFGSGVERPLRGRLAARLDAEVLFFGAGREPVQSLSAPCPNLGCPVSTAPSTGATVSASALANLVLYEQPDRQGFYLVAGLGPQFLLAHPDRPLGARLAAQAGVGVSIGSVVLLEIRYQGTLGARAAPRQVVLFTFGLRRPPPLPERT